MKKLISLFLIVSTLSGCFVAQKQHAEQEAREFMNQGFPGQWRAVSCMNQDTDNNGYTSCTVFMNNNTTIAIECANEGLLWQYNSGCKMQRNQMSNINQ